MIDIDVDIGRQILQLRQDGHILHKYGVSTAANGAGERYGSEQTPRGAHVVRARIGEGCAVNSVFVARRATGEIFTPQLQQQFPQRDWILTRILWLSGLEVGRNRLGEVDTMRRYIYIHGCPDSDPVGEPGSHGCIKMHNRDMMALFDSVPYGTRVWIHE